MTGWLKATTAAAKALAPKPKPKTPRRSAKAAVRVEKPARIVTAPRSASFRAGTHPGPSGALRYKLYLPAARHAAAAPLPLLVMLHGCGQTPEDFAKGTRMNALAEEMGLIVLYPGQSQKAHPNRCWNWYRPDDQMRDAGEPAALADLVRTIRDHHGADPARIYVAGLSAGASTAINLGHLYPDLFAAVGVHSGLPMGAARDKASALLAMGQGSPGVRHGAAVPTIIFHGSDDRVVNPRNGRFLAIRAHETYPALRRAEIRRQVPGGRAYIRASYRIGRGKTYVEHWLVEGSGHAWSGGSPAGRFVDPKGPDASREMLRFFLRHRLTLARRRG